ARLEVAEMHIPEEGETGIYFIESLDGSFINPLLGWWQGHFLVHDNEDGVPTVTDARGRDPATLIRLADPMADKLANLKQGRSGLPGTTSPSTVTPENFKQAVREALERPRP